MPVLIGQVGRIRRRWCLDVSSFHSRWRTEHRQFEGIAGIVMDRLFSWSMKLRLRSTLSSFTRRRQAKP